MCEFSKDQSWQADHLAYIGEQSHIRFEGQQEGIAEGEERNLVQNLRYLVEGGMTPEKAMESLHVPSSKWDEYREKIEPQKV